LKAAAGTSLAAAFAAALLGACAPSRPASAPAAAAPDPAVETRGEVRRLGASWVAPLLPARSTDGILVGRFAGAPYDLGLAFGRLTRPWIRSQETHLDALFAALVPGGLKRSFIRQLSAFRLRTLPNEIPPDLLVSIAGLADGYEPVPPASGWNAWRRMLDLHALHDVSQRFVDAPGLAAACTGFLARTPDGVLLARNFDFEGGDIFDRQKLVSVVVPDGRIPYLSVGFPGMLGVVSGFNREGIGLAVQAVAGGETAGSGEPVTLLLADVLRSESTFEGAVERLRRGKVFVSDLILVADAKTRRIAVVEKSPSAFALRETPAAWLGATNEAEDAAVGARARALPAGSTSRKRRARLDVLLARDGAALDVPLSVAILRDRRGADGAGLGPGNRNAIDASIAAHSVVLDLARRRAWVAAFPHTLGAYVPVDLEDVLASAGGPPAPAAGPLPADPWLLSGGYGRYLDARAALADVRSIERQAAPGWIEAAAAAAARAHDLSPEFAEATAKLGEMELRRGNREGARRLLDEALAHDPGPAPLHAAVLLWRDAAARGGALPKEGIPTIPTPDELIAERAKK
jgi:isopenicillin-N N-acyltransferase like protein